MKSPLKPNFMSPHIQCATDNMEHLVHYENFAAHTLQILIYFTQKKFIKAIAYNFYVTAFLWNKPSSRIWSWGLILAVFIKSKLQGDKTDKDSFFQ